jgi:NADH-quinone oxidoreductase subunit M
MNGLLTTLILTPWFGALLLACNPRLSPRVSRWLALGFSLSTLGLAAMAWIGFQPTFSGYQLVEQHAWIAWLNVSYHLGLDGMSLSLVALTGVIAPTALLASWKIDRDPRLFGLLFLLLQGAALGVFLALDFFPWFLFWELSLVVELPQVFQEIV